MIKVCKHNFQEKRMRLFTRITCVLFLTFFSAVSCDAPTDGSGSTTSQKYSKRSHSIPERKLISPPSTGIELGMGWDSRRGEIVPNHCIDFSTIRSGGQEISMDLREISDQSEMMDSLNVSAEVEVKTIFSSGSAKSNFAKQSKINSSSTTLLLTAKVDNGVIFVGPPSGPGATRTAFPDPKDETNILKSALKDTGLYLPLMNSRNTSGNYHNDGKSDYLSPEVSFKPYIKARVKSPDSFREHCGDYFVAAIFSGAELIATINYSAKSSNESQSIAASVKGDFGMVSASVSTAGQFSKSQSSTDFNMNFIQVGGGPGMIPTSKESLVQKVRELPFEANSNPIFHTIELRSYREIPESDGLVFDSKDDEFEVVSDYYWMLSSVYDEIDIIRSSSSNYIFWGGRSVDDLVKIQDEILDIRRALYEIMDAYYEGRLPNTDILDDVNYNWFPADKDNRFVLDIPAIVRKTQNMPAAQGSCTTDNWFDCVIMKFHESMPVDNPNTIRLLLPLPKKATEKDTVADVETYKKLMLDWYIRPQSKRMCALDPTDNECMSNAEIDALADLIPVDGNNETP